MNSTLVPCNCASLNLIHYQTCASLNLIHYQTCASLIPHLHSSKFLSFPIFISISPFHFQGSFQSHLAWVQSHLTCSPPCKNNIFHLTWKNSQNSREATPFPSIRSQVTKKYLQLFGLFIQPQEMIHQFYLF